MIHPLPSSKRAGLVVREVERLYAEGRKTVVWGADDRLRTMLDEYLWTYEQLAFRALEQGGWMLNEKEWADPLATLEKLSRLRKADD